MDIWPERNRFKELVLAYRRKHELNREAMADRLGLKESSLHGLLYDKRVRPSLDVVQRASEVFEVPIAELVTDFGSEVPGVGPVPVAWTDEQKAAFRVMGSDLGKLTPQQREIAIRTWRAMVDGFLAK